MLSHSWSPTWWRNANNIPGTTGWMLVLLLPPRFITTYPTVRPHPFCFSTRRSKSSSPVVSSHLILHQFLRPMMYLSLRGEPSVSFWKRGIWTNVCISLLYSSLEGAAAHHGFISVHMMQRPMIFCRQSRNHREHSDRRTQIEFQHWDFAGIDRTHGVFTIAPKRIGMWDVSGKQGRKHTWYDVDHVSKVNGWKDLCLVLAFRECFQQADRSAMDVTR